MGEDALVVRRHIAAGIVVGDQGSGGRRQGRDLDTGTGILLVVFLDGSSKGLTALLALAGELADPAQFLQIKDAIAASSGFFQLLGGRRRHRSGGQRGLPLLGLIGVGHKQGVCGTAGQCQQPCNQQASFPESSHRLDTKKAGAGKVARHRLFVECFTVLREDPNSRSPRNADSPRTTPGYGWCRRWCAASPAPTGCSPCPHR